MTQRNKHAGGHAFDFDQMKCVICGITEAQFEDQGESPCRGRPRPQPAIADDEPPPRSGAREG